MKRILLIIIAVLMVGTLAACTLNSSGSSALFDKTCSAQEAYDMTLKSGAVVIRNSECVSGKDTWMDFCEKASSGKKAAVMLARYFELDREHMSEELYEAEKNDYPQLYFTLLEYDGEKYRAVTRRSSEEQSESAVEYSCLMHYTGDMSPQSNYSTYDRYVLVNDPDVTWDDIERSIFSSQLGELIDFREVYVDLE